MVTSLLLVTFARAADPAAWAPIDADYRVHVPAEGPLTVEITWRFAATRPGWWDGPLVGPELVISDVTGPAVATRGGLVATLSPGEGVATIVVHGTLDPSAPGAASLAVLPTPRQHVHLDAPGLDAEATGAIDGWLASTDRLQLAWRPHVATPPSSPPPLLRAESATAVWADAGALQTRTRLRWHVLRGEVARFELDVSGLDEVEAAGAALADARREGDRLVLVPRAPVHGTFEVDVSARAPVTDGDAPVPAPRPVASRVTRYWTVGRAEDGELVPVGGPRAVPLRTVPEWGRGLSETPLESAWSGDSPLQVRVARFTPLMGPDTVIERAEIVVAAAREGRALVRTTWDVRNERRQYLHVTPPPGMTPMTARVSGVAALVLSDGAGGLYVPLEKSVETVQGLLTFPVEITWIAEGEAWERRGERSIAVPAVDAPIQDAAWQVYLPRGATAKGAHEAAPPPEEVAGSKELQEAVNAYKNNDFQQAQEWLDHARASGSESVNVGRLQSNLDVLLSEDEEKDEPEDVAARRVRSLANAKTVTLQVEQEKKAEEARKAYERGDVEEAEQAIQEVLVLSGKIGATEQKESAEQAEKRDEANELAKQVAVSKAQRGPTTSEQFNHGKAEGIIEPPSTPEPMHGVGDDSGLALGWDADGDEGEITDDFGAVAGGQVSGEPVQAQPTTTTTTAAATPPPTVNITDPVTGTFSLNRFKLAEARDRRRSAPKKPAPGLGGEVDKGKSAGPIEADFEAQAVPPFPTTPEKPPPAAGDFASMLPPPSPRPPDGRVALEVKAAPLTLALPLGGLLVEERAALLPAGEAPTLTIPYHFTREPR